MNKIPAIDKFAARLLMVSFFLPGSGQVLATMAACLYFVVRFVAAKERVPRSNYVWALFLASSSLLYFLAIPLTPAHYRPFLSELCERKISLLLLPFAFAIIGQKYREVIMGQAMYFVAGCVVVCLVGNADFIYHYLASTGSAHVLSHVRYREMFEAFTKIHPTYMGMFLCFSICITLLCYSPAGRGGRVLKFGLVYLLLVLLLSLLAKAPLIALVIIAVHYGYTKRRALYRYKLLIAGLLIAVAAACFFIPFIGQRVREVSQFADKKGGGDVAGNSVYVRQLIWKVDTDLLREHWLTGVGPGRVRYMLDERYFFYTLSHSFPIAHLDPHNEYFSEWLSFGVFGIVLFLVVLVAHFVRAVRIKNQLYVYLLIIFSITFFTETVLSRQWGVLFYGVFTSLFFFYAAPAVGNLSQSREDAPVF